MFHKIVDDLEQSGSERCWCETTRTNLRDDKRYLKTEYRAHCREDESTCPANVTHSVILRTARSKRNAITPMKSTLTSIETQISSLSVQLYGQEQKEDLLYDAKLAKDMVLE